MDMLTHSSILRRKRRGIRPAELIKIIENKLLIGRTELLQSNSPLVLKYLSCYLPQFESRGSTWQSLLSEGKIPRADSDIENLFAECDRQATEIQQKIDNICNTYQELNEMVNRLYGI